MNSPRLIVAVVTAVVGLHALPVFAHATAKDNDVNVILHTDPDDKPVAGKTSTLYFFVTDKDNQYSDENCDCRITISQNNKTIYNKVVHEKDYLGNPNTIATKYVFPKLGVFTVRIDGQPKKYGQFQAFKLNYAVRVETGTRISTIGTTAGIVLTGTGLIVLVSAVTPVIIRPRKPKNSK